MSLFASGFIVVFLCGVLVGLCIAAILNLRHMTKTLTRMEERENR